MTSFNRENDAENELDPIDIDPFKETYRERIIEHPDHIRNIGRSKTALLVIDMQYLGAARGAGVFADAEKSGVPLEAQDYYFNTLEETVIPNVKRVLERFREYDLEVIHTRIQSLTQDGRDRSAGHKRLGLHAAPGSKEAEFLPEVAPKGDELVINKTASGVFSSTNLYYVLVNMGIDALFVCGVYTNECVDSTIRTACDLGFHVTMIHDCCATVTPELHQATIATLRDRYARVIDTEQALDEIDRNAKEKGKRKATTAQAEERRTG